jgi:F-type H+-transporting ATPase subunit alpha
MLLTSMSPKSASSDWRRHRAHGVDNAMAGEMLEFPHGVSASRSTGRRERRRRALANSEIKEGDIVRRTGCIISVPSARSSGRVVNALGQPIDGKGPITSKEFADRATGAGVVDRQSVKELMQTGLKAIDAMVPIGRGQRELIIGDRQTGKPPSRSTPSSISDTGVVCIYNAIGQKQSTVAQVVRTPREATR